MTKRYIPPELKGMQEAPGFWPVRGASDQQQPTRSVYRRIARQKGEPVPTWDANGKREDKP